MKPFVHICESGRICVKDSFFFFFSLWESKAAASRSDHFRPTTMETVRSAPHQTQTPSDVSAPLYNPPPPWMPGVTSNRGERVSRGSGNNLDLHVPQSETVKQLHPLSVCFCIFSNSSDLISVGLFVGKNGRKKIESHINNIFPHI